MTPEQQRIAIAEACVFTKKKGVFDQTRRPWRSLVRVEDVEPPFFHAVIPGWSADQKIPIAIAELPEKLRDLVRPGLRLHAKVNRGALRAADLFFYEWEEK